jgi:hypothetical protein
MIKVLKLKPAHWQAMRRHVAAQAPLEACGLLAGKQDSVETVLRVRNAEQSPVRFRMDAQEQYNAFDWIWSASSIRIHSDLKLPPLPISRRLPMRWFTSSGHTRSELGTHAASGLKKDT